MTAISLSEASHDLSSIVGRMVPGESVTLTVNNVPVATLSREPEAPRVRRAGCRVQKTFEMSEDFDAPLEEFEEALS